ncbi:MAG: DNA adenine methylase [Desulfomonilaceae bacterium]
MQSISPLRYPGGKTRAVKKFSKYLPKDVTTICSPFFGGGSFELHCLMNYGVKVFGYDLFEPLVIFWNCLLADGERLAMIVSDYLPVVTKDQFYDLQRTFTEIEDPWDRASATYILNRTSFSGSMASGGFSPLEDDGRNGRFRESSVQFLRNFRIPEGMISVEHASFEVSIMRHPQEFVFLDPPYLLKSKLYGNRGDLHDIDHILLADILRSRDNWMLCYNECVEVRNLYRCCHFVDAQDGLSWQYGMPKSKNSREVLILSPDVVERLGLKVSGQMHTVSRRTVQQSVPLTV